MHHLPSGCSLPSHGHDALQPVPRGYNDGHHEFVLHVSGGSVQHRRLLGLPLVPDGYVQGWVRVRAVPRGQSVRRTSCCAYRVRDRSILARRRYGLHTLRRRISRKRDRLNGVHGMRRGEDRCCGYGDHLH